MRTEFSPRRFDWALRYTPHAADVLDGVLRRGARFATEREDRRQATDFVLMRHRDITAALRVRNHWALSYGDITLRLSLPTGTRTELAKILAGHGDFMVYGTAHADGRPQLCDRTVLDLAAFRRWFDEGEATWISKRTTTAPSSSPSPGTNSETLL